MLHLKEKQSQVTCKMYKHNKENAKSNIFTLNRNSTFFVTYLVLVLSAFKIAMHSGHGQFSGLVIVCFTHFW